MVVIYTSKTYKDQMQSSTIENTGIRGYGLDRIHASAKCRAEELDSRMRARDAVEAYVREREREVYSPI